MHMPVCICRHIGLHTYACIRMYMRICIFTHRSIYVYTQVYVLYTYMFIIHINKHTHAHTDIHVHIHRVMEHVDRTRVSRLWSTHVYMYILYIHIHTRARAHTHTLTHYTHIYTDTHAHAHTHIHVHIHRVMEHVDRTRASCPWTSAHPRVSLKPYLRTTKTVL
jgi:hypothetical protein